MNEAQMEALDDTYTELKEQIMLAWDGGLAEGLDMDFMKADMKDYIGELLCRECDAFIEMIWEEWLGLRQL